MPFEGNRISADHTQGALVLKSMDETCNGLFRDNGSGRTRADTTLLGSTETNDQGDSLIDSTNEYLWMSKTSLPETQNGLKARLLSAMVSGRRAGSFDVAVLCCIL